MKTTVLKDSEVGAWKPKDRKLRESCLRKTNPPNFEGMKEVEVKDRGGY